MCGLCLPHCPTYSLTLDENESPRGRISLARALLAGNIEPNAKTLQHLEHCLHCRACERMCPSGVNYGGIIDAARTFNPRELPLAVTDKQQLAKLNHWLWLYQKTGMQSLVGGLHLLGNGTLARKAALLPRITRQQPWAERYSTVTKRRGNVQLFTGCVSNSLDHSSLRAAVSILTQLGYDVDVPAEQGCCGALDKHNGNAEKAGKLAKANRRAFSADCPVISLHSGCSAALVESTDKTVMDICDFIIAHNLSPRFSELQKRIAIHTPCTKKNVMRNSSNVAAVLSTIPGADVMELPLALSCCGAAGSYMLDFPSEADAIRAPTIEAIRETGADILVTSNIGCAMHLQAGLREQAIKIDMMHPAELLAKLLQV